MSVLSGMNYRRSGHLGFFAFVIWLTVSPSVGAQNAASRVKRLNAAGLEAYHNLELEDAQQKLGQALQTALQGGVTGPTLARTYLNLGIIAIGGFQNNGQGLQHFSEALRADPNVQLDPLTSTPDIQSVFALARSRVGQGSASAPGPAPATNAPQIPHVAVQEQLWQTAVPVFVEVPADAPVGGMFVHYKAQGMPQFEKKPMERNDAGFAYQIPCREVLEPTLAYYLTAEDENGNVIGMSGSETDPYEVPIVRQRSAPPPALPGRAPPKQCAEDEECPPGLQGCESDDEEGADLGDTCEEDDECAGSMMCEDNQCVVRDDDGPNEDDMPRFFAHLGFTYGLGYATNGLAADRSPEGVDTTSTNRGFIENSSEECNAPRNGYCVAVDAPGFLPALAARLTVGYWIIPRLAAAVHVRYQFSAGRGTFASVLLGGRLQAQLTRPAKDGFNASLFAGSSFGQIQIRPNQGEGANSPFIISGLNSIDIGGVVGYRFLKYVGIVFTPEVHIMLPTPLTVIDLTLGVEAAF